MFSNTLTAVLIYSVLDMLRILFASSKWVDRINGLGHVFVISNYELLKFNWKCSNDITEITGT